MIAAGNPHARLAIRGSAVTKRSFDDTTRKYTVYPFDRGSKRSDFYFAIVDGTLFNKAIKANVKIADAGARTLRMKTEDLGKLGLNKIAESVNQISENRK